MIHRNPSSSVSYPNPSKAPRKFRFFTVAVLFALINVLTVPSSLPILSANHAGFPATFEQAGNQTIEKLQFTNPIPQITVIDDDIEGMIPTKSEGLLQNTQPLGDETAINYDIDRKIAHKRFKATGGDAFTAVSEPGSPEFLIAVRTRNMIENHITVRAGISGEVGARSPPT